MNRAWFRCSSGYAALTRDTLLEQLPGIIGRVYIAQIPCLCHGYFQAQGIGTAATSGVNGILATLDSGMRTNTVPNLSLVLRTRRFHYTLCNELCERPTDLWGTFGAYSATLTAYDVNGLLLGSVSVPDSNGQLLAFTAEGIHRFELSSTAPDNAAIAFDDVAFETPSAVPLPAAVWLFASGALGLGLTVGNAR